MSMQDHRLVRIALFLFFVAISLVYAVFVQVRGEDVRDDVTKIVTSVGIFSGSISASTSTWDALSWDTYTLSVPENQTDETLTLDNEDDSFLNEVLWWWVYNIMSWTKLYYGSLDIFKTLGIRYEYILKDNLYDIFYVYIGKWKTYNLSDLTRSLWWKTVEIYAKNDIINNLYFGDRVTFIELPQTPTSITSLFVRMGDDLWFIQDVTGEYKKHKRHIRQIFTQKVE